MTNSRQLVAVAIVAFAAGFAGALVASHVTQKGNGASQDVKVVRARAIEVVGSDGNVRVKIDGEQQEISMLTASGKERLTIALDNADEPIILLRDVKQDIRAYFGHETSDTGSASDDIWLAAFRAPGGETQLAAIGEWKLYRPTPITPAASAFAMNQASKRLWN